MEAQKRPADQIDKAPNVKAPQAVKEHLAYATDRPRACRLAADAVAAVKHPRVDMAIPKTWWGAQVP